MKTLEMRYGNPQLVLNEIINEMKKCPVIDPNRIELVEFAVRNM